MQFEVTTGTLVGGFRVVSLLGEGAMGRVYLAEDLEHRRRVALKLLLPELARDERFRERFLRESRLASRLDHPNVVPTLAFGEENGVLYIAMAYVDGADLRELLRRDGKLEPERALDLLGQVAVALDAAHALGLVHRDVKPANILIEAEGAGEHAYVCDFGLARHVSSVRSLTGERAMVGTIDYVPPEQIEGGPVDGRADVYSLACVLFECLAGARPFERDSELSVLFAHLNTPPPRVTDMRPNLPEAFDAVFATALSKAPEDRYATCGELVDAGRAALGGRVVQRRKVPRRRLLITLAAVVAAIALTGGLVAAWADHRSAHPAANAPTLSLTPNGLSLIDARTHTVVKRDDFGEVIWDIAFAGGSAWALLGDERSIARIDLADHEVKKFLKLDEGHGGHIAAGGGLVWVQQNSGPGVVGINAATGKVSRRFNVGGGSGDGLAYGAGSLWLARGQNLVRADPRSGHVLHRFPVGGPVALVAFADGAAWAASSENGFVKKVDPVANRVTATQKLDGWINDLTVGGRSVWAAVAPIGVVKLSEDDLSVQDTPPSGPDPEKVSFGGEFLWIASSGSRTVSLLEPASGRRVELAANTAPQLARYHNGLVWTSSAPVPAPLPPISGPELRISMTGGYIGADPSTSPGGLNEQLFYATCANLLYYPDSAGAEGTQLRPEVAASMPALSPDKRTYTFLIRQGIRFSPASPDRPKPMRQPANAVPESVTAQTFKHTIERALSPKLGVDAPAAPFASDIVGTAAFRAGKAAHIRGIIARENLLSIRLVRPAGDFLTRISMSYFCPVPTREPAVPSGLTGPIPSLGPYYVASLQDTRTVLLRNPNYRGRRPRKVERIVYTQGVRTPIAVGQVAAGDVDYLPGDFDPNSMLAPGGALSRRYGPTSSAARHGDQRYFLEPQPGLDEIVFNTRRPLFREGALRRAVNYALDRPKLAAVGDEPPSDEYVPPGVPGSSGHHAYPIDGPDRRAARRLARGSRRHAVLCVDPANRRVAEIVRSDLARIAISVTIAESTQCGSDPEAARADMTIGWFRSFEHDPEPFLQQAGSSRSQSFQRRLAHASELRGPGRLDAYARLDSELVHQAPLAVYASWVQPDYFSPRVGCKVFQSTYHFVDLGALCVQKPS
jgi:ABC-type transport system substrate-binding protein/tRNA A-37 threonylcarbamoyl transferase component Bud32